MMILSLNAPAVFAWKDTTSFTNIEMPKIYRALYEKVRSVNLTGVRSILVCTEQFADPDLLHWKSILYAAGIPCKTNAPDIDVGCSARESKPTLIISKSNIGDLLLTRIE